MRACTTFQVPIVIVSAAIGDVVEKSVEILVNEVQCNMINRDNIVHVIANKSEVCP